MINELSFNQVVANLHQMLSFKVADLHLIGLLDWRCLRISPPSNHSQQKELHKKLEKSTLD